MEKQGKSLSVFRRLPIALSIPFLNPRQIQKSIKGMDKNLLPSMG